MIKLYIFTFFLLILVACDMEDNINYNPIGYFSTNFNLKTGAPRQGTLAPESTGIIVLDKKYTEALRKLEEFEYIFVLFHFHKAKGYENIVKPPESDHEYGLFATRSPRRPNPIALSLIKLDSIVENKLYVSGIDAFDKTPVLDIKPFLPSVDSKITEKNIKAELFMGHHDEDFINDSLVKIFVEGEK